MTVIPQRAGLSLSLGEYAMIGVLRERPMHGYEIARRFTADLDLGLVLPLEMGSVYAMLKDLQGQGLLEGRRETVGRRPPRTVFSLSPEADAQFDLWLRQPVHRMREVRSDLLVKLYFCRRSGPACTCALLDAQIDASLAYVARQEALVREAAPESFERLVSDAKLAPARATVEWLRSQRATLAG